MRVQKRFDCIIELDTDRTIENMKSVLTEEFGVWGGMAISEDSLSFTLCDRSMNYAMCGLHTIAQLLTCPSGSYTVSIWESGTKGDYTK